MAVPNRLIKFWFLFVPTIVIFYIALWLTILIRYPAGLPQDSLVIHLVAFSIIFVAWLVVFFIHNLFEAQTLTRLRSIFGNLISAVSVSALLAIVYFYVQPDLILTPRRFLLLLVVLMFVLMFAWLMSVRYIFQNQLVYNVYLFSPASGLDELETVIVEHAVLGYSKPLRITEPELLSKEFSKNSLFVLPDNLDTQPTVLAGLYSLRRRGLTFVNHKLLYETMLRRVFLPSLTEVWFLENVDYRAKRWYQFCKRVIDILAGLVMGLFFAISFPFIALLIKFESKGPIFFIQKRVGQFGQSFSLYKYRTMSGGATNTWTAANDSRITSIGKWLRKLRIDELPQCLNILKGDMSLVGPRPEQVHIVEELREQIPFYEERHLVKPGLTGWAQLHAYAGTLEETKLKLQYDLYYIKHRAVWFDVEIILKTIYAVLSGAGK